MKKLKVNAGFWLNGQGEVVELEIRDQKLEQKHTNGVVRYNDDGTCLVWNSKLERYVMHTDPKADLVKAQDPVEYDQLKNGYW